MVDLSQDPATDSALGAVLAHAEGLGQGVIDLMAFGLVASALWLAHPRATEQQPLPVAAAPCQADCITLSALGGPNS